MNNNSDNSSPDFGEMLNRLLENPDALENIMKIASTFKNVGGGADVEAGEAVEASADGGSAVEASGETAGAFRGGGRGGHHKPGSDDRLRLLKALKPYLGDNRREKVDYIIKLLGILQFADGSGFGGLINKS